MKKRRQDLVVRDHSTADDQDAEHHAWYCDEFVPWCATALWTGWKRAGPGSEARVTHANGETMNLLDGNRLARLGAELVLLDFNRRHARFTPDHAAARHQLERDFAVQLRGPGDGNLHPAPGKQHLLGAEQH